MKKHSFLILPILAATLATCIFTGGCVSPSVSTNSAGQSVTNYVVSPSLSTNSAVIAAGVSAASPLVALVPGAAPVAPFLPDITSGVLGLVALISGAFAAYKNNQANKQTAAAAALASAVVGNPAAESQAVAAANVNQSTALVAQHIQNAKNPV